MTPRELSKIMGDTLAEVGKALSQQESHDMLVELEHAYYLADTARSPLSWWTRDSLGRIPNELR